MLDLLFRNIKEIVMLPLAVIITKKFSPNILTLIGFFFGLISVYFCFIGDKAFSFLFWSINRIFDGLDGVYARKTNQQTNLGGYLDILTDFMIYGLIPVAISSFKNDRNLFILMGVMETVIIVNTASLFFLSAILEKNACNKKDELTTVTMPPALIEGSETVIFFSLFILLDNYTLYLFLIFTTCVTINIVQRFIWAVKNKI